MEGQGEADLSAIGKLVAEPARARVLMALSDGRWLPASMLALEAGVANSTMSEHLAKLVQGGMIVVRQHGRYRYYRLAGPQVAELVEAMARVAPTLTITSLREGTRAHAIRRARHCYDHLAGRLAIVLMSALLREDYLAGEPGAADPRLADDDAPNAQAMPAVLEPGVYTVSATGAAFFGKLDLEVAPGSAIRCCVDWTEHRHHLAGPLGRALLSTCQAREWVKPGKQPRVLLLTGRGRDVLGDVFRVDLGDFVAA